MSDWDSSQVHSSTRLDIEVTVVLFLVYVVSDTGKAGASLVAKKPCIVAAVSSEEAVAELYIKYSQWVWGFLRAGNKAHRISGDIFVRLIVIR